MPQQYQHDDPGVGHPRAAPGGGDGARASVALATRRPPVGGVAGRRDHRRVRRRPDLRGPHPDPLRPGRALRLGARPVAAVRARGAAPRLVPVGRAAGGELRAAGPDRDRTGAAPSPSDLEPGGPYGAGRGPDAHVAHPGVDSARVGGIPRSRPPDELRHDEPRGERARRPPGDPAGRRVPDRHGPGGRKLADRHQSRHLADHALDQRPRGGRVHRRGARVSAALAAGPAVHRRASLYPIGARRLGLDRPVGGRAGRRRHPRRPPRAGRAGNSRRRRGRRVDVAGGMGG